jgi:hypothetical protein
VKADMMGAILWISSLNRLSDLETSNEKETHDA